MSTGEYYSAIYKIAELNSTQGLKEDVSVDVAYVTLKGFEIEKLFCAQKSSP